MPTVIDSFLVAFGIDSKGAKEGANEVKHEFSELKAKAQETGLGFSQIREEIVSTLAEVASGALFFKEALNIKNELIEFAHHTVEADEATGRLSKALNKSVEEIGTWQGAAVLADGSVEGFNQSIKGLAGSLIDIEKGLPRAQRALIVFEAAGIGGLAKGKHQDVMDILLQLSDQMQKMSSFEAGRLGGRLGLDAGTIRLLRQGRDAIEESRREVEKMGVATTEEVRASEEFNDIENKITLANTSAGRVLREIVLPVMQLSAESTLKVAQFVREHAEAVKAGFIGLAAGVTALGIATVFTSSALGAFTVALLTNPVTWIVLGIAAAVAALVTAVTYLATTTNRSGPLGKLAAAFQDLIKGARGLWDAVKYYLIDGFRIWWMYVSGLFETVLNALGLIVALLSGDQSKIMSAWDDLANGVEKIWTKLRNNIKVQWWMMLDDLKAATKNGLLDMIPGVKQFKNVRSFAGEMATGNVSLGEAASGGTKLALNMSESPFNPLTNNPLFHYFMGRINAPGVPSMAPAPAMPGTSVSHSTTFGTVNVYPASGTQADIADSFHGLANQADHGTR